MQENNALLNALANFTAEIDSHFPESEKLTNVTVADLRTFAALVLDLADQFRIGIETTKK